MIVPATTPEEKGTLLAYLASKIGTTPGELVGAMPFECVAITRGGLPIGAAVFTNFRGKSIELSWAGEKGWLTRANLRDVFAYPFVQLGCWTVLGFVQRSNVRMRQLDARLGFREVGIVENGEGKDQDTVIYAMTKAKCPWIERSEASNVVPMKRAAGGSRG